MIHDPSFDKDSTASHAATAKVTTETSPKPPRHAQEFNTDRFTQHLGAVEGKLAEILRKFKAATDETKRAAVVEEVQVIADHLNQIGKDPSEFLPPLPRITTSA